MNKLVIRVRQSAPYTRGSTPRTRHSADRGRIRPTHAGIDRHPHPRPAPRVMLDQRPRTAATLEVLRQGRFRSLELDNGPCGCRGPLDGHSSVRLTRDPELTARRRALPPPPLPGCRSRPQVVWCHRSNTGRTYPKKVQSVQIVVRCCHDRPRRWRWLPRGCAAGLAAIATGVIAAEEAGVTTVRTGARELGSLGELQHQFNANFRI